MRRKLINQDAFDRIISESVNSAERELVEAEQILARAMGKDFLRLKSFTESTVLYETVDGSFVHAGYEIKNGQITLNNVEELIIDESSQKEKRRAFLSEMIDSVLVDNNNKAKEVFKNYLDMVRWNESKSCDDKKMNKKKNDKENNFLKKDEKEDEDDDAKHSEEKKSHLYKKAKKVDKDVAEAYLTSQNALEYVDFIKIGPTLAESLKKFDEKGNLTNIRIPSISLRNESMLQRTDWKNLNGKISESRKEIVNFAESQNFCKAIESLRRQNAFSDSQGLEEALDHIVKSYPQVIYATKSELSEIISEALETMGKSNYDDATCDFMAEGILHRAHDAYSEKVNQILHLASASKSAKNVDKFEHFQNVVENFYPVLDEKFGLERKVFADLYESIGVIFKKADRTGNGRLKNESASYLNELAAVLNNEVKADLDLVKEAATFLSKIIETNLETGKWVVHYSPHETLSGDHPEMAKKASVSYSPDKDFSGNYGDPAPSIGSDDNNYRSGKNSKEMRNNAWGQEGGSDVFPKLKNPYIPKAASDYTMKGEKGADKYGDTSDLTDRETFPNINNPFVKKEAGGPGGKGYRMNNGSDTDLVAGK
jgi:hypothetical protein